MNTALRLGRLHPHCAGDEACSAFLSDESNLEVAHSYTTIGWGRSAQSSSCPLRWCYPKVRLQTNRSKIDIGLGFMFVDHSDITVAGDGPPISALGAL